MPFNAAFSFISFGEFQSEMKNNSFLTSLQTLKTLEWVEEMSVAKLYRYR